MFASEALLNQGPAGAAAPKLIGETIKCTTFALSTTCNVTINYAATSATLASAGAVAKSSIHGTTGRS